MPNEIRGKNRSALKGGLLGCSPPAAPIENLKGHKDFVDTTMVLVLRDLPFGQNLTEIG